MPVSVCFNRKFRSLALTILSLSIALGALPIRLAAQSFTVSPNPVRVEVDLDTLQNPWDLYAEARVENRSAAPVSVKWKRIANGKPDCWETAVFGVWIQAAPRVDSLEFDLAAGASGPLGLLVFTGRFTGQPVAGEAEVVLQLTNQAAPFDTLLVNFQISASGTANCLTPVFQTAEESVLLYPNPVRDYFFLRGLKGKGSLVLYDQLGRTIRLFQVRSEQPFFAGDLPAGLYWLTVRDESGQSSGGVRLLKR